MDPIVTPLLIAGVSQLIGFLVEKYGENEARKIVERARAAYGTVDPQALQNAAKEVLGPTEFAKIQVDPSYRQAQQEALGSLKNISDSGGLTIADKAVLQQAQDKVGAQESAARAAAIQNLRQRGLYSSGAEMAQTALAQQAGANRAADVGLQTAALAQQRALQALQQRAQLAGQMGNEDYSRAANAAQAQDAINRMNWGARWDRNKSLADAQMGIAQNEAAQERAGAARTGQFIGNTASSLGGGLAQTAEQNHGLTDWSQNNWEYPDDGKWK